MLENMIHSPMPTRAEITDVANAVFEQADAIMLSGETTVGKYPVQCVGVFDRIPHRAELAGRREKRVQSAVAMPEELQPVAIPVFTIRGKMARHPAWMRARHSPI